MWPALRLVVITAAMSVLIAAAAAVPIASAQRSPGASVDPKLPPLSMTCPMHPDVVESRPGSCPLCKMALVPVRLDTAWMCPVHTTVIGEEAGSCRICRRQLVQVRVAVTWTCLAQPGIDRLEPGRCPDGSAMVPRRTLRAHGNHNPQHGGQFFMAPDNWHHLEGTYPRDRLFRLYLYDDYARPLSAADMKRVQARVVTRETFDPATRKTTEIAAFPLRASRDGAYLEARVEAVKLPAELTAKVRIKPDAPEYRFDFTFQGLTKEPPSNQAVVARRSPTPAPRRQTTAPAVPRDGAAPEPVAPSAAAPSTIAGPAVAGPAVEADLQVGLVIPETIPEILDQLKVRDGQIRGFIKDGNFGAVWVPAFQAKDLAIALEPHLGHLAPAARERAEPAVQQVVRFAWLLDAFGDVGNRQQLEAAYSAFSAAVSGVAQAFAGVQ